MKAVIVILSLLCLLSTVLAHGGVVQARVPACWNTTGSDQVDACGNTNNPCGAGIRGTPGSLPTIPAGTPIPELLFFQLLGHAPTNISLANNSYVLTIFIGDPLNGTNLTPLPLAPVLTFPQNNTADGVTIVLLPAGSFTVPSELPPGILTLQVLYNATADTVTPGEVYPSCIDFEITGPPTISPPPPPTSPPPPAPTSSNPSVSTPTVASNAVSVIVNVVLLFSLLCVISLF